MRYRLSYTGEAKRALRDAPGFYRQRCRRAIEELTGDPRPIQAEPMRGPGFYKIRLAAGR